MSKPEHFRDVHDRCHASIRTNFATLYNVVLQHHKDARRKPGEPIAYYDRRQDLTNIREDRSYWNRQRCGIARGVLKRTGPTFFQTIKAENKPGCLRFQSMSLCRAAAVLHTRPKDLP